MYLTSQTVEKFANMIYYCISPLEANLFIQFYKVRPLVVTGYHYFADLGRVISFHSSIGVGLTSINCWFSSSSRNKCGGGGGVSIESQWPTIREE